MPSSQLVCAQQHPFLFLTITVCRNLCLCHPQLSFNTFSRFSHFSQLCCHSIPHPFLSFSAPSAQISQDLVSMALGFSTSLCLSLVSEFPNPAWHHLLQKLSCCLSTRIHLRVAQFTMHPCLLSCSDGLTPSRFQNSCSHCNHTYACGPSRVFTDYRNGQKLCASSVQKLFYAVPYSTAMTSGAPPWLFF